MDSKKQFTKFIIQNKLNKIIDFFNSDSLIDINEFINEKSFTIACEYGRLEILQWFYENWILCPSYLQELPFRTACEKGYIEIAKWLINIKPNINVSIKDEYAFRMACKNGHYNIIRWLIYIKPTIDVSILDNDAFVNACYNNHIEIMRYLYSIEPSIYYTIKSDFSTTYTNCLVNNNFDVVIFLTNIRYNLESTLFYEACEYGYLNMMNILHETMDNIIIEFIFLRVCKNGHLDILKWFVEKYYNFNVDDHLDFKGFETACLNGHIETVKYIYMMNNFFTTNNSLYKDIFYESFNNRHYEICNWLLQIKPIINNNDCMFKNACIFGELELAKWFVSNYMEKYVIINIIEFYYINELTDKVEIEHEIEYKILKKFPTLNTIKYNTIDECIICWNNLSNVILPCSHLYCIDCVKKLFYYNNDYLICPYCRNESYYEEAKMIK